MSIEASNKRVYEEILYGEDEIEEISEMYNDIIFISMLKSAQIADVDDLKVDFYNAEIARHESLSKDEDTFYLEDPISSIQAT